METAVALPAPAVADVLNRLGGCATWTALCAVVTYRDVSTAERRDGITSAVRTVLDCALKLPFVQALVVADSALRAIALGVRALRFTPQLVAELTGTPAPPQPQEERRAVPA